MGQETLDKPFRPEPDVLRVVAQRSIGKFQQRQESGSWEKYWREVESAQHQATRAMNAIDLSAAQHQLNRSRSEQLIALTKVRLIRRSWWARHWPTIREFLRGAAWMLALVFGTAACAAVVMLALIGWRHIR